jgi:hypothetical protein
VDAGQLSDDVVLTRIEHIKQKVLSDTGFPVHWLIPDIDEAQITVLLVNVLRFVASRHGPQREKTDLDLSWYHRSCC